MRLPFIFPLFFVKKRAFLLGSAHVLKPFFFLQLSIKSSFPALVLLYQYQWGWKREVDIPVSSSVVNAGGAAPLFYIVGSFYNLSLLTCLRDQTENLNIQPKRKKKLVTTHTQQKKKRCYKGSSRPTSFLLMLFALQSNLFLMIICSNESLDACQTRNCWFA